MQQIVVDFLDQVYPMSEELKRYLLETLKPIELKKKDIFLKQGDTCDKISFIVKGMMRSFSLNDEGGETTVWFMKEGDVAVSIRSFFLQEPSEEFIEVLEDVLLVYVNYEELQTAYKLYPEFNIVGRLITEKYYVQSEERMVVIRNKSARERYDHMLQLYPEILLRVPSKHIASYLDIDQATLSRLKGRK
jgi:CRP-like cAMP-binding protein